MVTVTLNGKKYECPACYEELTTRQYQRMVSEWIDEKPIADRDFFKLFCILTNSEFKTFHATAENEVTIWNAIRWTVEQPFSFSDEFPKALQIDGRIIMLPKKVGALSIGQNIHLRQVLDKSKFVEEGLSMATAIYIQPLYNEEKFDFDKALELEKKIGDMPAYLIRPIGFFMLTNALTSGRMQGINWLRTLLSHIRSKKRMWQIWPSGKGSHLMPTLG